MYSRESGIEPPALRVLCVDDHPDAADSEALLLEIYGCTAAACYDGPSALAEALRFGPDVCLIDYNMPGLNGCDVARRLRAWRSGESICLIAVTAHGNEAMRALTAQAGFDHHFVKPLDWEALGRVLAQRAHALGRTASPALEALRG